MKSGFSDLHQLLQGCLDNGTQYDDFQIGSGVEEEESIGVLPDDDSQNDFFQVLSVKASQNEKLGPDVPDSLATLANKLLQTKHDPSNKEKYDKYLRPNYVSFLDVPQINKPVWTSISRPARLTDSNLQFIQRDFLRSAIPVLNVMQKLNESRDNLLQLDARDLIRCLSDSLSFIGSVGMVKQRRSLLKNELPPSMHPLCNDLVSFSGSNLFGDSLSTDIKEISELNKLSSQLRGRATFRTIRGSRSRGSFPRVSATYLLPTNLLSEGKQGETFLSLQSTAYSEFKTDFFKRAAPSKQ